MTSFLVLQRAIALYRAQRCGHHPIVLRVPYGAKLVATSGKVTGDGDRESTMSMARNRANWKG
jgi:hypothetical protein